MDQEERSGLTDWVLDERSVTFNRISRLKPACGEGEDSVRAEETCPFVPIRRPYTRRAVLTLRWFNRINRSNKLVYSYHTNDTSHGSRFPLDSICHLLTQTHRQLRQNASYERSICRFMERHVVGNKQNNLK
jgi:hypothetical protein